jgi:electron transfer flavoprotein beta subunit
LNSFCILKNKASGKVLFPINRVFDYKAKVSAQSDDTGLNITNFKMSMNPFEGIQRLRGAAGKGAAHTASTAKVIHVDG